MLFVSFMHAEALLEDAGSASGERARRMFGPAKIGQRIVVHPDTLHIPRATFPWKDSSEDLQALWLSGNVDYLSAAGTIGT